MNTDNIMKALVRGTFLAWCEQGHHVVMTNDFEPKAAMCNQCIGEAMADAGNYFGSRGLVASAEEQHSND